MGSPTATRVIHKINPATEQPLGDYPMDTAEVIAQKVQRARACAGQWAETPLKMRAMVLKTILRFLKQQAEPLALRISAETGKPLKEAYDADLASATGILSYVAKTGPVILQDHVLPLDKSFLLGRWHIGRRVPRGVVAILSPWNYPLGLPVSGIAQALMAGNAVILKPSEFVPGVSEALVQCVQLALQHWGFSKDILQLVQGDAEAGQALVSSDIDYVCFTGSTQTGRLLQQQLLPLGKGVGLELGGSDPMLILPDADFDAATSAVLWGRFTNAGQTCAAVKRLYVPKAHHDQILRLLQTKMNALSVGPPTDHLNHVGPLISQGQKDTITAQVADALKRGAQALVYEGALPEAGYFYPPTLLTGVSSQAQVLNEEVFGPVLPIVAYETIDEAVGMANQSQYALTACVFGDPNNPDLSSIASRLHAGNVLVNDIGATNYAWPTVPWGGWKNSGPGWSHGTQGLLDFTLSQTLTVNHLFRLPAFRKAPWFFSKQWPGHHAIVLAETVLHHFGTESFWEKCHWRLLQQILKNRASTKI